MGGGERETRKGVAAEARPRHGETCRVLHTPGTFWLLLGGGALSFIQQELVPSRAQLREGSGMPVWRWGLGWGGVVGKYI